MRILKYSAQSYLALRSNSEHTFAAQCALRIYQANAIYSFIPKNACSTLRLSLAIANGCIESTDDFNWIHANNKTFSADLPSLANATYTFTVLRCPYARLASAYLNKIVEKRSDAWQLLKLTKRRFEIEEITFDRFIKLLRQPNVRKGNLHWRPQVDFLVYKQYDDYFCLEEFSTAVSTLKDKINLDVVDARPLTKHGIDRLSILSEGNFSKRSPSEIYSMKASGQCPAPRSLYTDELVNIVNKHYKADIDLYKSIFGTKNLMFVES